MLNFFTESIPHLIATYGYVAVFLFVAIESTGIPFPGETMLIAASAYAGAHSSFHIWFVIPAAAAGAIVGDNLGYLVGREGGFRLVRRFGPYIHFDERKLKLGMYLFRRHGGKVVFFGRFVAVLRAWAAFLAGTSRMPWRRFFLYNAAGGILWATIYGLAAYAFGNNIKRITGPIGIASVVIAAIAIVASLIVLRRNMDHLQEEAEREMPGPVENYVKRRRDKKAA
jgi:membrane protein DedA with SNARE-associated domain